MLAPQRMCGDTSVRKASSMAAPTLIQTVDRGSDIAADAAPGALARVEHVEPKRELAR